MNIYHNIAGDSGSQLCLLNVQVLIKMKVIILGLTFVSVIAFKLVISVEGDQIVLNENEIDQDLNITAKESEVGVDINLNHSIPINKTEDKPFLLPNSVLPVNYKLEVLHILDDVDLDKSVGNNQSVKNASEKYERFTSPGKVWVEIEVLETTRNITLHAEDMTIGLVRVRHS